MSPRRWVWLLPFAAGCADPLRAELAGDVFTADAPPAFPGAIAVPNLDDDDADGEIDWEEPSADDDDLRALHLNGRKGRTLLTLHGDDVRVWFDGALVLEEDGDSVEIDGSRRDGAEVFIEVGDYLATAELVVENGRDSLTIPVTGAPLLLNHHLQPTDEAWVVRVGQQGFSNAAMIADITAVMGDRLVVVPGNTVQSDIWIQDEFETGTMTAPGQRVDLTVDSVRDRGLDDLAEEAFWGSDQAVGVWGSGQASTYDSFGNLEVSPPVSVDGADYPFGRIYYGQKGNQGPKPELRDFLAKQALQAPFAVDTTWLCVGHVDEFSTFVPDPTAPRGFRFLYADTRLGMAIVDAADPATALPRYADDEWSHGREDVASIAGDTRLRTYNERVQTTHLDPILAQFRAELGLLDEEIVPFPAVFEELDDWWGACGAAALVPGIVNLLLVNEPDGSTHAFLPDPFFRADESDLAADPFIAAAEAALPANVTPHWVDDWDVYHLGIGEVHCGTNQRRTPDREWWTGDLSALGANGGGVQ